MALLRAVPTTPVGALPPDADLVVAARRGEPWASDALVRRHARRLNGLAFRLIGRDEDVDDLVQDTFAYALTSLDRLKDTAAFGGWLSAILVRSATKVIRRRRLFMRLGLGRASLDIDLDTLVSPAVPPDHALELRRIYAVAAALPADLRIPLLLRRVEGLELEEIRELTGVSLATVKRRIKEAEDLLRSRYTEGGKR